MRKSLFTFVKEDSKYTISASAGLFAKITWSQWKITTSPGQPQNHRI